MGSLAKAYNSQKLYGQVYTSKEIVCKILDDVKYNSPDILGKYILDPACGDGRFLMEIVERIIRYSPIEKLSYYLGFVFGWDIDEIAVQKCRENLNKIIKNYGIFVRWNIFITDSIKKYSSKDVFLFKKKNILFDYIIGNPPYIRIQHLSENQRKYIQKNYTFCRNGSTDIYIAFYELCFHLLSRKGICGLITPNSFISTEAAKQMRLFFSKNNHLLQITNYGSIQLFKNATTYSAITIFNKNKNKTFLYQKALDKDNFEEITYNFSVLKEPFWQFFKEKNGLKKGKKLKDFCTIHVGIQTLCDKAYIFEIEDWEGRIVIAKTKLKGRVKIEKNILKPIIKVSKLKNSEQKITEYILFPYQKTNNKNTIIAENILKQKYPFAYKYLQSIKQDLKKRDNGKPIFPWYAFGRNNALDNSFGKKILFAPINIQPNFVLHKNEKATFYSGYCIKCNMNEKIIMSQLNSKRMQEFIAVSSRDFRNGWKAYNKKIVENFFIEL